MKDRQKYDAKMNQKRPVIPFRAPSRQHHNQVKAAANAEGLTVSEWVRRAVHQALEEQLATK